MHLYTEIFVKEFFFYYITWNCIISINENHTSWHCSKMAGGISFRGYVKHQKNSDQKNEYS
jgi:hypothetical protein